MMLAIQHEPLDPGFAGRIRRLREKLGLTQVQLAQALGVSFASVNRWENEQARPGALAWQQVLRLESGGLETVRKHTGARASVNDIDTDTDFLG